MHLHEGETPADVDVVAALLAEQVPGLAGEPIEPVPQQGTVHHVFRVGRGHVARLPRAAHWASELGAEAAALDRVGGRLPVAVPEVVHEGTASDGFPHAWLLQRWVEGEPVVPGEDVGLADVLADVVEALRALPAADLPPAGRAPLADLDRATTEAIEGVGEIDRRSLRTAWSRAADAPVWDGTRTAIHADLLPDNLLQRDGRIVAVIDWGSAGAGDPAHDLIPAWTVLRGEARGRFRARVGTDAGDWARARGIALHQALVAIPYYRETHPRFAAMNVGTASEAAGDAS